MTVNPICLFLIYGTEHYASGINELQRLAARLFHDSTVRYLVIDNAMVDHSVIQTAPNIFCISGDNKCREFSGWDKGFHYLQQTLSLSPDVPVIIANDTFHRNYGCSYLQQFSRSLIEEAIRRGGIVGYYDAFSQPVTLFGMKFKDWLRTSILIGPYRAFSRLLPLSISCPDEELFSSDPQTFFCTIHLSKRYQGYLKCWLTGDTSASVNFKEKWHSQEPATAETFHRLKQKARCILSEHYLSARARKLGIPLLAINRKNIVLEKKEVLVAKLKKVVKNIKQCCDSNQ